MPKASRAGKIRGRAALAGGQGLEEGVCILCGGKKEGVPARADLAISAARKLRSVLGMPERRTVACRQCFPSCAQRRAAFEREMRGSKILSAIFFAFVLAGGAYFGGFQLWLLVPAVLGSAVMLLLPYGKYFPDFRGNPATRF